ncbi:hypothetical protein Tco_0730835 [Tanacetum coccineum]
MGLARITRIIGQTKDIYSGTMAGVDINTLTKEQYLALSRENQAPGVVKPEIRGNVNFEIKSQFMRELREDTFSGNKNEDAHDHVDRVLNIGPIPRITRTQALTAIQTMADHSQKWHDGTSSKNVSSNINTDGLATIIRPHLDKECPLNEEVKQLEEVKYGEFRRSAPFNESNGAKFRVGPPGYYTRTNNRPPYGEKRPSLEELMNKQQEESVRTTNGAPSSYAEQCKVVNNDHETQHRPISSRKLNDKEGKGDQGASVNVMPRNTFEYLRLANLRMHP